MRCYICDYSPDTTSLYYEELQLNNFADLKNDTGLSTPSTSGGYHSGKPKMMIDPQGREVCSSCAMHGQHNEYAIEIKEHEELEEVE